MSKEKATHDDGQDFESDSIDGADKEENESQREIIDADEQELLTEILESEETPAEVKRYLRVVSRRIAFSGPLPPPQLLREYGQLIPELPAQIVEMAKNEQSHRHQMESGGLNTYRRGQLIGAFLMILLILGAAFSVYIDNTIAAGIFLGTAAVGAISKFLTRSDTEE